jgi:hypothetical protein
MWYYNRYIDDVPEDQIPPKPEVMEIDEVTLDYVDFGFINPQDNWHVLAIIENAEKNHPSLNHDRARQIYMDWAFEDAQWKYGVIELADNHNVRNAIADYLTNVREWNDGEYVHPWSFD